MINPYVTEFPADPKYFVGRGKELRKIKKAIDCTIHSEPVTIACRFIGELNSPNELGSYNCQRKEEF